MLLLAAAPLAAGDPASNDIALPLTPGSVTTLARRTAADAGDLATFPRRWRRAEWTRFGEGLALVGAAYVADDVLLRAVQRNRHHVTDQFLRNVTKLGGGLGANLTLVAWVTGALGRDERLMNTGIDAFEASLFAAGVVTPSVKLLAGRARPIQERGRHSFRPLDETRESFPSGHATNAFAIATVIATRYDDHPSVGVVAYALATGVALARVNDRVHFPSDVIAGALIGRAVAKSVAGRHIRVMPAGRGLVVSIEF